MDFLPRLIWRNLFRQKLRTGLTALGLVIAVIAFALLRTLVESWYGGVNASSSSRLITRHAISLGFSLPIHYRQKIRQVAGVYGVSHATWFGATYINEKNFFPQFAIEPASYFPLFPELSLPPEEKAEFLRDRKGVMVGRKLAAQYGWKVGDIIPLRGTIYPGDWNFVIRGIYRMRDRSGDESMFLFHYDYLNETLKKRGDSRVDSVGIFFVGIDRPNRAAAPSICGRSWIFSFPRTARGSKPRFNGRCGKAANTGRNTGSGTPTARCAGSAPPGAAGSMGWDARNG